VGDGCFVSFVNPLVRDRVRGDTERSATRLAGMAPTPDAEPPTNRHWRTFLKRVWTRKCPRCGGGRLFASRFRLREGCSECDLVYRREAGAMTGQMYLSAAVTEIFAAILVGIVFVSTDWSAGVSIAVCLPLLIGFSF
jgi:uncharacterized protein (DUF983 family)